MKRRLVALAAAVSMAVTVAACDSGSGADAGTGTSTMTSSASGPSGTAVTGPSVTAESMSGSSSGAGLSAGGVETSGTAGSAGSVGSAGSAAEQQVPVDQLSLSAMLALIPDRAAYHQKPVVINLYWKAAADGGVTVPAAGAGKDALQQYEMALTALVQRKIGMYPSDLFSNLSQYPDAAPGFGLQDIAADVQTQTVPRIALAARGRFDRDAVDAALRGNGAWADELTTPTYRDHTVYRWGDDLKQDLTKANTGLFTQLGQARRFSVPDPSTFEFARDDATMYGLLDAHGGAAETLASDARYAAITGALDRHGVYSAVITPPVTLTDASAGGAAVREPAPNSAAVAAIRDRLAEHALHPYRRAGIGEALSDGRPRTIVVLSNADSATAKANVTAFRALVTSGSSLIANRPWSDFFTVRSVTAEGSLTVAVLEPADEAGNAFIWSRALVQRDNLLMMAG